MIGGIRLTLSELMRALQDLGVFVVVVLLAYAVYKVTLLIDAISNKIKGEKD